MTVDRPARKVSSPLGRVMLVALGVVLAGCGGTTERSGVVGDTLSAKGIDVTVLAVDGSVPVPANDVTGLSQPAPGSKLVAVRVRVCSNHGGAIGPYDFGVETAAGEEGQLKYPETNYADSFDSQRSGCGGGWVVFEIPMQSRADRVEFGFEDTGSAQQPQTQVDARFSWAVK